MTDSHEGPVSYRFSDRGVIALCSFGHVLSSTRIEDWAGSAEESDCGRNTHKVVRCFGTVLAR